MILGAKYTFTSWSQIKLCFKQLEIRANIDYSKKNENLIIRNRDFPKEDLVR